MPTPAWRRWISGESREVPTPLAALRIPETMAARSRPRRGEMVPMMMPKHTAPVPEKNSRLSVTSRAA